MAQNNVTPIPFWLSLPLREFAQWREANNVLVAEREKARKSRRKK